MTSEEETPLFVITTLDNPNEASTETSTPDTVTYAQIGPVTPPATVVAQPATPTTEQHERTLIEPVRRLHATIVEVLDADANPDRHPDEAIAILKDAMDTFQDESVDWLNSTP